MYPKIYTHNGLLYTSKKREATYKDLLHYLFQHGLEIQRRPRMGLASRSYTLEDFLAGDREHLRMLKVSNINILKVVCYNVFTAFGYGKQANIMAKLRSITTIGSAIELRNHVLWNKDRFRSLSLQEMTHYGILNFGWPVTLSRSPYIYDLIKLNATIKKWEPEVLLELCKTNNKRPFEMHRGFITAIFCLSYVAQIEFIRSILHIKNNYMEYYYNNEIYLPIIMKVKTRKKKQLTRTKYKKNQNESGIRPPAVHKF